ncbi:helix-turn-helix transcriptional regulator [Nostoc sp. ChiQUE01b]|uniref:helix-turn-helix domain-containing protein n=1 Tax=Nostoc sp. ChiQUE01b TaxID=3075376 RepID=UPI002AD5460E|nr:helix-turn-helix transcriptional regulator [Nostoc sp. ChiQUE01b]MDZ8262747.1 helix-turn-helix transcriptional regulator [Nostoc sp. ChiQUE01b]
MLTLEARERLSKLCIKLRGDQRVRQIAEKAGVVHSAWSDWENGKGNLGESSAQRLAAYIGTTVGDLQIYLNAGYSLEEYLRIPQVKHLGREPTRLITSVEEVFVWMEELSLYDLARITAKGGEIIQELVAGSRSLDGKKNRNTKKKVTYKIIVQLVREHRAAALEAFLDAEVPSASERIEAIIRGQQPNPSEVALLTQVLPIDPDELYDMYLREFPSNDNGDNKAYVETGL